jgi:hypothetical protein
MPASKRAERTHRVPAAGYGREAIDELMKVLHRFAR